MFAFGITNLEVGRKQVVKVAKLLVDYESKDIHLGYTSIVQLDGTIAHL